MSTPSKRSGFTHINRPNTNKPDDINERDVINEPNSINKPDGVSKPDDVNEPVKKRVSRIARPLVKSNLTRIDAPNDEDDEDQDGRPRYRYIGSTLTLEQLGIPPRPSETDPTSSQKFRPEKSIFNDTTYWSRRMRLPLTIPKSVSAEDRQNGCGPLVLDEAAKPDVHGILCVRACQGPPIPVIKFTDAFRQKSLLPLGRSQPTHLAWGSIRGRNRPEILYKIKEDETYAAKCRAMGSDPFRHQIFHAYVDTIGSVLVNDHDLKPLRYIAHFPSYFIANVEGWYMHTLKRIDPDFTWTDIWNRIASGEGLPVKPIMKELQTRQWTARQTLRLLPWPIAPYMIESIVDELLLCELDDWARSRNSTRQLADLTDIDTKTIRERLEKIHAEPSTCGMCKTGMRHQHYHPPGFKWETSDDDNVPEEASQGNQGAPQPSDP